MENTKERLHPRKEYLERFAWFWYFDQEIFYDTQEDIDKKMENFAKQGINHVITFSNTHARMTSLCYAKEINACIGKIVKAAHKLGIRVTEHHSANITRIPTYPVQRKSVLEYIGADPKNWQRWIDVMSDPNIPNYRWFQKTRNGEYFINPYKAFSNCWNNEEFVKVYLDYLEDVYKQGVDGIMTDDVQYMGWNMETCYCEHCRKRYKDTYGVDIPDDARWNEWFGDMTNPDFINWIRCRIQSTYDFTEKVRKHYEKLGYKLYRPNYCSARMDFNPTAYCLEELTALDCTFQECCNANPIRYSWLWWFAERLNRTMMSQVRNIPAMMLFYADRKDTLDFVFGLAHVAGGLFTNTPVKDVELSETQLRSFEIKYQDYLFELKYYGGIGVLDSLDNRYYGAGYNFNRLIYWLEAGILHNVPICLVDVKHPETWKDFSCISLLDMHLLSDDEIANLIKYTEEGGTLLVAGHSACQDQNARLRTPEEIRKIFGLHPVEDIGDLEIKELPRGKGKIIFVGPIYGYGEDLEQARENLVTTPGRFRYGTHPKNVMEYQTTWLPKVENKSGTWVEYPGRRKNMKEVATFLQSLLPANSFKATGLQEGVIATAWTALNGETVIQMLNAVDTIDLPNGAPFSHNDKIPFPQLEGTATFRLPRQIAKARFISLDDTETSLEIRNNEIQFPASLLKTYGIIVAE